MQPLQVIKTSMQVSVQEKQKYLDGSQITDNLKKKEVPLGDTLQA